MPDVPTLVLECPLRSAVEGKWLNAVLTLDEKALYIEKWDEWMKDHTEDYVKSEDKQDLHTVCMEHVMQYRLLVKQKLDPKLDISSDYNQAVNRMQKARENLAARRVDRVGSKANRAPQSIAVLVGMVDPARIEDRRREAEERRNKANNFLEGTIVREETKVLPFQGDFEAEAENA